MLSMPHWKETAAAGNIDPSAPWGTINDRHTKGFSCRLDRYASPLHVGHFGRAWREAQQGFPFKAQPLLICAYEVDCQDVADLTDGATRSSLGVDPSDLACAWEKSMSRGMVPPSWTLARRLFEAGTAAAAVPSFAPGALASDRNVVFWRWADTLPHQIRVIDDDQRLPRDTSSRL